MKCDKCDGKGEEMTYSSFDIEAGLQECVNCKGTGKLTTEQETIYNLKNMSIHEDLTVSDGCYATRVIGGWIYNHYSMETGDVTSSVFVTNPC